MPEPKLGGRRILVVEDEYLLADDLRRDLERAGALVVGPVGRLAAAIDLIRSEPVLDGAILDINLGGDGVYPAADLLMARAVPIVFSTGYDASSIPDRYAHVIRCEKPVDIARIIEAMKLAADV